MSSSRSFDRALKSVVIISAMNDRRAFCSGCVLSNSKDRVLVVCPAQFIKDRSLMLQVCFFDGKMLPATVWREHGNFCLLDTPTHEACVGITWSQESLDPNTVFMFVPKSPKKNERKDAYLSVESVKAYLCDAVDVMETNSDDYFMILCDYIEQNVSGVNRLAAAPVFTTSGNALGLVLQNCRAVGSGVEMKVVMKASAVKPILRLLDS